MFIKPDKTILKRGTMVLIGAIVLWGLLLFRLFWLQIVEYDKYHQLVIENITSTSTISAPRGIIYDCNMTELAINTTVKRIFISPADIANEEQKEIVARYLSEKLDVDYDEIITKANDSKKYDKTIKNYVDLQTAEEIMQFVDEYNEAAKANKEEDIPEINCIYAQDQSKRYYPLGSLAAHTIGFTGFEGSGLYGLEMQYNDYLTGVAGKIITSVNARGGSIPTKYESYTESESGYNIVTTIDYKIQSILENYLKQPFYDNDSNNRTCGVVMDCNTGAILAIGTYPNFDLNDPRTLDEWSLSQLGAYVQGSEEYNEAFAELRAKMWNNKPITELYEPGSTFKIITAAIGIEENAFTEDTLFTCTDPYYVKLSETASKQVRCWHYGGHGTVTFRRGLQQSCNPTLMQAVDLIGRDTFYKYVQAFGYTAKTGIDLPGEAKGIFHNLTALGPLELATSGFGQTNKTTAIQQLTAICTVANGGKLVTPYMVSRLVDDDGNTIKDLTPTDKRVLLSEQTCSLITDILTEGVSTDGAARNAYVKGYKVAAKTGTSEKTDIRNEAGETYLRVGSCVGYAPADDPQVAIIIICDEPMGESVFGSVTAAPYVSHALGEILPYLNIDPVYTEEELADMEVNVPGLTGMSLTDAIAVLNEKRLAYKVYGDGTVVNQQIPKSGSTVIQGSGQIVLYTGSVTPRENVRVPELLGYSISGATKTLTELGLNIILKGAVQSYTTTGSYAQAISQSIPGGTKVTPGTVVEVEFRFTDAQDGG